jgi:hypothetical protein
MACGWGPARIKPNLDRRAAERSYGAERRDAHRRRRETDVKPAVRPGPFGRCAMKEGAFAQQWANRCDSLMPVNGNDLPAIWSRM